MTSHGVIILIAMSLGGLLALFLAWKVLVLVARGIVGLDAAMFGRRAKSPVAGISVVAEGGSGPEELAGDLRIPLAFGYRDADGRHTDRTVIVDSVHGRPRAGPDYVVGFDELRRARRTFRIDRMTSVVQAETGEVIDDARVWLKGMLHGHVA